MIGKILITPRPCYLEPWSLRFKWYESFLVNRTAAAIPNAEPLRISTEVISGPNGDFFQHPVLEGHVNTPTLSRFKILGTARSDITFTLISNSAGCGIYNTGSAAYRLYLLPFGFTYYHFTLIPIVLLSVHLFMKSRFIDFWIWHFPEHPIAAPPYHRDRIGNGTNFGPLRELCL
jgi:hypothetical protein